MNKRIKELLLKVVPMEGEDGELMPSLHTQRDIEQFAELIVKDCIGQVETNFAGAVGTYAGVHNSAVLKCKKSIQEHFGVE